jgi:hypothetical protein
MAAHIQTPRGMDIDSHGHRCRYTAAATRDKLKAEEVIHTGNKDHRQTNTGKKETDTTKQRLQRQAGIDTDGQGQTGTDRDGCANSLTTQISMDFCLGDNKNNECCISGNSVGNHLF